MADKKIISTFINALKRAKHLFCLRDKNGKKYRKSVMLYGFYGMNLGDDMFFEKLLTFLTALAHQKRLTTRFYLIQYAFLRLRLQKQKRLFSITVCTAGT